jgi:hypothetical protein
MAAFSWTTVGDYIKGLIWEFNKANTLKENVSFNNEIFAQWHKQDNSSAGNAANQGLSQQIRSADGSAVSPTIDYGGHVVYANVSQSVTANTTVAVQLDDATNTDHGTDYTERSLLAFVKLHNGSAELPTNANSTRQGWSEKMDFATVQTITASTNTKALYRGFAYTDNGIDDGTPTIPATPGDESIYLINCGPTTSAAVINGAIGASSADGDLVLILDETAGTTATVNLEMWIFVSPQFAA